jgi:hypothetical protein
MTLQDHFAALNCIRNQIKPAPPTHPKVIDWSNLLAKASEATPSDAVNLTKAATFDSQLIPGSRDVAVRNHMISFMGVCHKGDKSNGF